MGYLPNLLQTFKMKTFFILAAFTAFTSIIAAPVAEPAELDTRANLPGLNAVQSANARAIIAEVKKENLGTHGCQAGITTALTEVRILQSP